MFPHEPIVRVRGPILQAQLVETRAAHAHQLPDADRDEGGARRARRRGASRCSSSGCGARRASTAALGASRAAYIGGCAATSNVLAGKLLGIPVRGTHAHSWVMFHGDELEAFRAYAEAMPGNCMFLVDTYDTLEGVRNAITVGRELRARGHELAGIRLDSGDLAYLSIEARELLDEAGFPNAKIVASQRSRRAPDRQPPRAGRAHRRLGRRHEARHRVRSARARRRVQARRVPRRRAARGARRSSSASSRSRSRTPACSRCAGCASGGELVGDVIYDSEHGCAGPRAPRHRGSAAAAARAGARSAPRICSSTIIDRGEPVARCPTLEAARARAAAELAALSPRTSGS